MRVLVHIAKFFHMNFENSDGAARTDVRSHLRLPLPRVCWLHGEKFGAVAARQLTC